MSLYNLLRPAQRSGQLGPEDLECDLAMVLDAVGEIDCGHAALAQLAVESVAGGKGGGGGGTCLRHRGSWTGGVS